jgi:hypothetical protein
MMSILGGVRKDSVLECAGENRDDCGHWWASGAESERQEHDSLA